MGEDHVPRQVAAGRPGGEIVCWLTLIGLLYLIEDGEHACSVEGHRALVLHVCPYLRAIRIVVEIGMTSVGDNQWADQNEGQAVAGVLKAQEVPQKMPA